MPDKKETRRQREKRKEEKVKATIASIIILAVAVVLFASFWVNTRDERNELQKELALATIVGYAHIDHFRIEALDESDQPAEGLRIELYQVQTREDILVQEVQVDTNGQYQFTVMEPGMYYVIPVPAIPGYPGWSWITHLRPGNILVEKGKTYLGPIFLARENEGQG